MKPYERLLALTQRQRELIALEDYAAAVRVAHQWERLVESLPPVAPSEARPLLEEAAAIAWANTEQIEAHIATAARRLDRVAHGRRAVAGYR